LPVLSDIYTRQGAWQTAYQTRDTLAGLELWLQRKRQIHDAKVQMTELKSALDLGKKGIELTKVTARQQQEQLFLVAAIVIAALLAGFLIVVQRNRQRINQQRTELAKLNATKDRLVRGYALTRFVLTHCQPSKQCVSNRLGRPEPTGVYAGSRLVGPRTDPYTRPARQHPRLGHYPDGRLETCSPTR